MLTAEQNIEVNMYGCTIADLREQLENSLAFKFGQVDVMVMGMLSDAQEMVAYESPTLAVLERQRRLLNCAKWAMREYILNRQPA